MNKHLFCMSAAALLCLAICAPAGAEKPGGAAGSLSPAQASVTEPASSAVSSEASQAHPASEAQPAESEDSPEAADDKASKPVIDSGHNDESLLYPLSSESFPEDTPRVISFLQALRMGVAYSPELEAARAHYEQGCWQTEYARTGGNPKVNFSSNVSYILPEVSMNLGGMKITTVNSLDWDFGLTITQAIATFGRLHYSVLASQLAEKAAMESYRQALESEMVQTASAYVKCMLAKEEVVITEHHLESRKAALKDAEALFEAGTAAKYDVLRYRSEATAARQSVIEAKSALAQTKAALCSRLGMRPGTPFELAPIDVNKIIPSDMTGKINLAASIEDAIKRRPELAILRWTREAAEARCDLIKSSNNPTLALQSQVNNGRGSSMSPWTTWATSLVLQVPIYDAGERHAQLGEMREAIRELDANIESAERAIRLDVETTYYTLQSTWLRINQARVGLEQAEEAERVAEIRYKAGLSTSTELLDAQTSLVDAQQALAIASHSYLLCVLNWVRATSGAYPIQVPGPLDPDNEHMVRPPSWYGNILKDRPGADSDSLINNLGLWDSTENSGGTAPPDPAVRPELEIVSQPAQGSGQETVPAPEASKTINEK